MSLESEHASSYHRNDVQLGIKEECCIKNQRLNVIKEVHNVPIFLVSMIH